MEEQSLLPQMLCPAFIYLYQPRSLLNWIIETRDVPNELGLFYVVLPTVPLYVQWYQFVIFQIALPTPSHWVP